MPKSQKLRPGYIFAVKDPDTGLYFYVGQSQRPHEYIFRLATQPAIMPLVYEKMRQIFDSHPLGIEILGDIITDRFHAQLRGEPLPPMPEKHPYRMRLEYDILGIQDFDDHGDGTVDPASSSLRSRITHKLISEGHPLLWRKMGNPHKKKTELE